jgi:hypothetical protein
MALYEIALCRDGHDDEAQRRLERGRRVDAASLAGAGRLRPLAPAAAR